MTINRLKEVAVQRGAKVSMRYSGSDNKGILSQVVRSNRNWKFSDPNRMSEIIVPENGRLSICLLIAMYHDNNGKSQSAHSEDLVETQTLPQIIKKQANIFTSNRERCREAKWEFFFRNSLISLKRKFQTQYQSSQHCYLGFSALDFFQTHVLEGCR